MNLAAEPVLLAAAGQLLISQLISLPHVTAVLCDAELYPEEFLDLFSIMSPHDRRLVIPVFDDEHYLASNPDVASLGVDPLIHFVTIGIGELRSPHPLVNLRFMREARPDLFPAGMNLREFIDAIERNLCDPGPYFSAADYLAAAQGSIPNGTSAFIHFLTAGAEAGARPNRYLDPQHYASHYDDVPAGGLAAVLHFVAIGDRLARQPSADFDPVWYRARYLDAADALPLLHFQTVGRAEGYAPLPNDDMGAISPVGPSPPRGTAAEVQQRYRAFVNKLAAQAQERRSLFKTYQACPVYLDDPEQELSQLTFAQATAPKVDILIPCFNEFECTVECLAAIARSAISSPYRVIVADDASTDPRMARLAEVGGLIHLVAPENRHFLRNANGAFGNIAAEYLLLLNNDAQLTPGCVDALVRVLDEEPDAAAAAPMILYPNGRLQEAGCAIRFDGTSVMVGVGENPEDPAYNCRRRVHYASGACLLLRRSALGDFLFDERYAPAYCEDMDLCTRLREAGHAIVYEPAARVVHHVSVSTGRASETQRLQLITANQAKFVERWADRLERDTRVRVLAFYLPQFHPVPQNDLWWGKGFTEWRNVARARPSFSGHYQPHLPADLGFYDLRLTEVMGEQQKLARRYGIEGFVVYYYNFAGQRILEAPMERLLAANDVDFRFALCWANENWTKHWDGGGRSILLEQSYDRGTLDSVADDAIRFARDPRAITVAGKPLFLIYRPLLIPDTAEATGLLRRRFAEAGFLGLHLVCVESMELAARGIRPSEIGFDAAVEFPPQEIALPYGGPLHILKKGFSGQVYDYEGTLMNALGGEGPGYTRYPGVFASWDNTARQPLTGTVVHGASPELFQAYVEAKLAEVEAFLVGDERLLFVNAWNEWAEGAHLEPDQVYGHRWLAAIRNALIHKGMFR